MSLKTARGALSRVPGDYHWYRVILDSGFRELYTRLLTGKYLFLDYLLQQVCLWSSSLGNEANVSSRLLLIKNPSIRVYTGSVRCHLVGSFGMLFIHFTARAPSA